MEIGLLLGLKARVKAAQGASPGLDRPPKDSWASWAIPFHGIAHEAKYI